MIIIVITVIVIVILLNFRNQIFFYNIQKIIYKNVSRTIKNQSMNKEIIIFVKYRLFYFDRIAANCSVRRVNVNNVLTKLRLINLGGK